MTQLESLWANYPPKKSSKVTVKEPPLEINIAAKGASPWVKIMSESQLMDFVNSGYAMQYVAFQGTHAPLNPTYFLTGQYSKESVKNLVIAGTYYHKTRRYRILGLFKKQLQEGGWRYCVKSLSSAQKVLDYYDNGYTTELPLQYFEYDSLDDVVL